MVVHLLHTGQDRTRTMQNELIFILAMPNDTRAYLSIRRPNVLKHRHGMLLREVLALADAFKELSIACELKSEIAHCTQHQPFLKIDLQQRERTRQARNNDM
jgi:hypothetical protein